MLHNLRWKFGNQVVQCFSSKVSTFLAYSNEGATFVFSYLANGKPFVPENYNSTDGSITETVRTILGEINDQGVVPIPFFFGPLSLIYFVSFFVSMLYYWGTLQFVVKKIGGNFDKVEVHRDRTGQFARLILNLHKYESLRPFKIENVDITITKYPWNSYKL